MATGSSRLMATFARRMATPPLGSDADLLDRFASTRDEAAFQAILHRHGAAVFGVCRARLGNVADAEDAFQATFLVLARDADRIRNRESLAGWLFRVAQLVALKTRRREAVRTTEALVVEPQGATPEPIDLATNRELQAIITEELAALPDKFRSVLVLCALEGHTNTEAATILNCPRGTVDSRLATAKQKLKARLLQRGIALGTLIGLEPVLSESATAAAPFAKLSNLIELTELFETTSHAVLKFTMGQAELSPALLITQGVHTTMSNMTRLVATGLIAAGLCSTAGMGYFYATAEDQAKPTVKAEAKLKTDAKAVPATPEQKPEKPPTQKANRVPLTEPQVREMLSTSMQGLNIRELKTIGAVFDAVSADTELQFRVDLAAFKRLYGGPSGEGGGGGLPADYLLYNDRVPANLSASGTLHDLIMDLMTVLPYNCSYRVSGNQIIIGPGYIPMAVPNRTGDPANQIQPVNEHIMTEQLLGPPVSISLYSMPLQEAIRDLRKQTGANIVLDTRCLKAPNAKLEVSGTFDDVRLYTVLELLADMCDLKPVVVNNVFYVTTPQNAEKLQKKVNRELFGEPAPPQTAPAGLVTDGTHWYYNPGTLQMIGGSPANPFPLPAPPAAVPPKPTPAPAKTPAPAILAPSSRGEIGDF